MPHIVMNQESGEDWTIFNGDSVDVLPQLPSASAGLVLYSPPFSSTYTYSPSERDLGNVKNEEQFFEHFGYITRELRRVLMPGRIMAVHCAQLPRYTTQHGYTGRYDFRGDLIRHFESVGFIYHSEICIDKNPQAQAIRNHSVGLMFMTLDRDASAMWQGWPDYVLIFRNPGDNPVPVVTDLTRQEWIRWARPVWYASDYLPPDAEEGERGIRETDVLPVYGTKAEDDERHLCPLQLPVIERIIRLWSNKGDVVLDPFMGIGSVGCESVRLGRKGLGIELNPFYFRFAVGNLTKASRMATSGDLFTAMGVAT